MVLEPPIFVNSSICDCLWPRDGYIKMNYLELSFTSIEALVGSWFVLLAKNFM